MEADRCLSILIMKKQNNIISKFSSIYKKIDFDENYQKGETVSPYQK